MGVGHIQVGIGADNTIEFAAKFQVTAEQAAMQLQVVGSRVGEVDAVGVPACTEHGSAQTEQHADDQLIGLTAGYRRLGDHLFANDHHLSDFFNMDGNRRVHQMTVMHQHL
ncbi:hypothetical protein D3C84_742720 [compost metagenome]